MKRKRYVLFMGTALLLLLPFSTMAQGMSDAIYKYNDILDKLLYEMLPACSNLMDVGRVIGGLGALSYIAVRIWKHIAKAEAIDFFPLLRPFGICIAIVLFPQVIALMNGVLKPTEVATRAMSGDALKAIYYNIDQQEQAIKQDTPVGIYPSQGDDMDKYEQPDGSSDNGVFSGLKSVFTLFNIKSFFKIFVTEVVQLLYTAAGLCINTIRTFYLIILALLGPIVFGLSIFDGFQNTLSSWFARYINVFMWLPVANIFSGITSKILENLMTTDQGFFSSTVYLIFMIISAVGYTTVPNVAGYIIQAGGRDTLLHKVNALVQAGGKAAVGAALKM